MYVVLYVPQQSSTKLYYIFSRIIFIKDKDSIIDLFDLKVLSGSRYYCLKNLHSHSIILVSASRDLLNTDPYKITFLHKMGNSPSSHINSLIVKIYSKTMLKLLH